MGQSEVRAQTAPRRRLRDVERAFATVDRFAPLNLVVSVLTHGPSLAAVLPGALQEVQGQHPLLRATIAGQGRRAAFCFDTAGPLPLRLVSTESDAARAGHVEAELNQRFDTQSGPLARCVYEPTSGHLIFTFHHAIADGSSAAHCVDELLAACRGLLEGTDVDRSDQRTCSNPGTVDDATAHRLPNAHRGWRGVGRTLAYGVREGIGELSMRVANRASRPSIPTAGRSRVVDVALDPDETAAVVAAGRRERVTMTSLLTAASLRLAVQDCDVRSPRLQALAWADLRPHLDPPVPAAELGCHVSMLRCAVAAEADLWTMARRVGEGMERAARRGDRFSALAASGPLATALTQRPTARLATVAASYAPWPLPRTSYGAITVSAVSGAVSNNPIGAVIGAVAGVFAGSLWCNLIVLDAAVGSESDLPVLGANFRKLLVEAAR